MSRSFLGPRTSTPSAAGLLLVLAVAPRALGHGVYRDDIPNAYNVPSSIAIGHVRPSGGGARNNFGVDFAKAGYVWTKGLCAMDSDGDGRSNGEELGDTSCSWKKGDPSPPIPLTGLTNPGVADVPNSAARAMPRVPAYIIAHGVLMGLAWLALGPLGVFAAMLRDRVGPGWFQLHQRSMVAAGALTVAGAAVAIANVGIHADSAHEIIGLVLFAFVVIQLLTGALRPAAPHAPSAHYLAGESDNREHLGAVPSEIEAASRGNAGTVQPRKSSARRDWEAYHKNAGKVLVALAVVNVALGIKLAVSESH